MSSWLTAEGLNRAWARVWKPAALIAGLMIILSPRTGILGVVVAAVGVAVWLGGRAERTREMGRYIAGFAGFAMLRNLADDVATGVHYSYVIAWERAFFGGVPTLVLQKRFLVLGHWDLLDLSVVAVYLSYFLIPPTVLVLLWSFWPGRLKPYVTATLMMFGVSLIVHVLLPTAPPWLASNHGYLPPVHQVVRLLFGEYAPATYHYGEGLSGNAVAAMPSVHLAVTTLISCALWRTRLRGLSMAYVVVMGFTVVYGGEHYAVDGIAGVGLALVAWPLAEWLGRLPAPRDHAARRDDAGEAILDPTMRVGQ